MIRAVKDEEHRGSRDVPQPSVGEIINRKEIKDNKKIHQWAQFSFNTFFPCSGTRELF
jgi:hypothetical protein